MTYHFSMVFEWDDSKAESNKKKHGVSFAEASTAFSDPNAIEILDRKNSDKEDRWILVGISNIVIPPRLLKLMKFGKTR